MAQNHRWNCGTSLYHKILLEKDKNYFQRATQIEAEIYKKTLKKHSISNKTNDYKQITVPVVFHVIYQQGKHNISEERIQNCVKWMSEGFRNMENYASEDGADVFLEFCLAQIDPQGNPTNGITRHESELTINRNFDQTLKKLWNWNPLEYLNVYVVERICETDTSCGVAGYAVFAYTHGQDEDGIVVMADYIGVSPQLEAVMIHEAGHYFNLFHPFEYGCLNKNCLLNGDRVCDTPPDSSSSSGANCDSTVNSCTTDVDDPQLANPFKADTTDRLDLFMDYIQLRCMRNFTRGQVERMRIAAENVRTTVWIDQPYICTNRQTNCPTPKDFQVEIVQDSILRASWLPVGGVDRYEIRYRNATTGKFIQQFVDKSRTNWELKGAFINQLHTVKLRSWCNNDTSHFANVRPDYAFPTFCEGQEALTEREGTFDDGSGKAKYGANSYCQWFIMPENVKSITIWVDSLDTELDHDWLYIYDIRSDTSILVAKLSGNEPPKEPFKTGGVALIGFTTDPYIEEQGWQITYKADAVPSSRQTNSKLELKLYPNPSNGVVNLQFQETQASLHIKLRNTLGQEVYYQKINTTSKHYQIQMDIAPGYYILEAINSLGRSVNKPLFISN